MDDIDIVKQKIEVGDLIESYIPVKRAGKNLKAICPFHNEKSPSFVISSERQIWHCFGCGKGGDIFTFIQEYERVDFPEALKILADRANVKLSKTVFKDKQDEKKSLIYEINHLSSQFYHFLLLKHPSGKEALSYVMEKRGLTKALLETYLVGVAPHQPNALVSYLTKKKGYKNEELIESGVATFRNGRLYDFFQNRLIFPITDARGNILAFSGRALTDEAMPKYINTKETPVYVKGNTVFGLTQAKETIKKEGKVLLMEGEFDVITSYKEGITNAVAIKGTALTENQIRLLKRFSQKIVFCFDTDPAGTEAQRRSISLITKEGVNASVVVPPKGKDADELLRENPGLFKKALKNEVNIYDYIIDTASRNDDSEEVEEKKNILLRTLPYLSEIENEIVKEHYFKKLATLLDTSYESVVKESSKLKYPQQKEEKIILPKSQKSRQEMIEEHLLTLILQSPNPKESLELSSEVLGSIELTTPVLFELFSLLQEYFRTKDTLNVSEINKLLPEKLVPLFDMCFLIPLTQSSNDDAMSYEVEKIAKSVRQSAIKEHLKRLSDRMKTEEKQGNEEELQKLRETFDELATHFKS